MSELPGLDFKLGQHLCCLCPARNPLPLCGTGRRRGCQHGYTVVQHWKRKQLIKNAKLRESEHFLRWYCSDSSDSSGAAKRTRWTCAKDSLNKNICHQYNKNVNLIISLSEVGLVSEWQSFLLPLHYKHHIYFHSPTYSTYNSEFSSIWEILGNVEILTQVKEHEKGWERWINQ